VCEGLCALCSDDCCASSKEPRERPSHTLRASYVCVACVRWCVYVCAWWFCTYVRESVYVCLLEIGRGAGTHMCMCISVCECVCVCVSVKACLVEELAPPMFLAQNIQIHKNSFGTTSIASYSEALPLTVCLQFSWEYLTLDQYFTHTHSNLRTQTHAHTHAHTHTRTRTHMHTHARTHTYLGTHACTHTHTHTYTRNTQTHTW